MPIHLEKGKKKGKGMWGDGWKTQHTHTEGGREEGRELPLQSKNGDKNYEA